MLVISLISYSHWQSFHQLVFEYFFFLKKRENKSIIVVWTVEHGTYGEMIQRVHGGEEFR